MRQTQRSPEGPRHLHRIPRLSEAPWQVPYAHLGHVVQGRGLAGAELVGEAAVEVAAAAVVAAAGPGRVAVAEAAVTLAGALKAVGVEAGHKRRIPLAVVLPPPARGAGTLIPSAQRFVWVAKQPLGNAALAQELLEDKPLAARFLEPSEHGTRQSLPRGLRPPHRASR